MTQEPPLLDMCPKEMKSVPHRDSCPPMFIATLSTIRFENNSSVSGQINYNNWKVEW
jgi:hypothetical protein